MRQITIKYEGTCAKCGAILKAGEQAIYEKRTGIFCVGCEPTETEDIRHYRQIKANAKADKYDEWADKRETKATADLNSYPEIRHDWAFITQPGHIPLRAKMNRADDKAMESLETAKRFREKANNLRKVRVAGDAERARQKQREKQDQIISKGSKIHDFCFGNGVVIGVYKKSYRIKFDTGYTHSRDKTYIQLLN